MFYNMNSYHIEENVLNSLRNCWGLLITGGARGSSTYEKIRCVSTLDNSTAFPSVFMLLQGDLHISKL